MTKHSPQYILILFFLIFFSLILFSSHAFSSDLSDQFSFGIRLGKEVHLEEDDFESYEASVDYEYPWEIKRVWRFILTTKSNFTAGVIDQDGDAEFISTFSQLLVFTDEGEHLSADFGGGIGLLGDDKIGEHDFGTSFQFNYNFGITVLRIFHQISIGYRLFHLSDAGIGGGQGLNRHILEIRYDF